MRKITYVLMAAIMLFILPFQTFAQSMSIQLAKGTPVVVKTVSGVSSNSIGEIMAIVEEDVVSEDGHVLIKSGTPVIVKAYFEKNGSIGKPGKITLSGANTTAIDGKTIILNCGLEELGKDNSGLSLGLGIGTGILTLFGLLFLLIKGGNAEVPAGTIIPNTFVSANYDITIAQE